MSDPVEFRLQLDVTGKSEEVVTEFCIAHLRERGYAVAPPNEKWETIGEFNARLALNHMSVWRALERPGCPDVAIAWGKGKRRRHIVGICSNPAFEAFLKRYHRKKSP